MKEIVLDTETTGLSVENGHRIVEIGCIELDNQILTSNRFHCYLNPQRKVSEEAFKVQRDLYMKLKDFEMLDLDMNTMRRILDEANKANILSGIHCASPEYAAKAIKWGFDLVTVNSDVKLLSEMANQVVNQTRKLI